jgi:hypothetical protein
MLPQLNSGSTMHHCLNVPVRDTVGCQRICDDLGDVCQLVKGGLQGFLHLLLECSKRSLKVLDVISQPHGLCLQDGNCIQLILNGFHLCAQVA